MAVRHIRAEAYFDGTALHDRGPYLITVRDGGIVSVGPAAGDESATDIVAGFAMPGLVDAHVHIFLDGSRLGGEERAAYLQSTAADMHATARANVGKCTRAGVTVVRDAGDGFGINHAIRRELRERAEPLLELRSAGAGLRRRGRYGRLLAREVDGAQDIPAAVEELCRDSDDIKIMLTGIVDFAAGCVNGPPQFDLDETRLIVAEARKRGRRTFAHCSGVAGLEVAVAAGVDSIEHGFFMTRDILRRMADAGIAWVPTFAPVHVQWARPEIAGWNEGTVANLERILAAHAQHVALAHELGVTLVAGSDAGSPGVDHGCGLIDELFHLLKAGLPMAAVLTAATARPRALWGTAPAALAPGERADMILLDRSPFESPDALRQVRCVIKGEFPDPG